MDALELWESGNTPWVQNSTFRFTIALLEVEHLRVDVLQLLQQPLVLPADKFLVPGEQESNLSSSQSVRPEHHVPDGEEVAVLPPETLVLAHVVLDQLDQGGRVQLVQPTLVDLLLGGWSSCGEDSLNLGTIFKFGF